MTSKLLLSRAWILPALATAAGCFSLDTDPGLRVQQSIAATAEALPAVAHATAGSGTVAVSGRIVGKLPCDLIDGDLAESSDRLHLTITVVADRNRCPGRPPTTWTYVANIVNLEPGPRTVVVEHRFQGVAGQGGVVLETVVDVR